MNSNIKIDLLVSHNALKISNLSKFLVGVKLTNKGDEPIAFDVSGLSLFVNGKRSISWDLAVQNGTTINLKIVPNQSETIHWRLGDAIFESAGEYELRLESESFTAKQIVSVND